MRHVKESRTFKRDKKRIDRSGQYGRAMRERFIPAVLTLANDGMLDYSYHDHELIGKKKGIRECHILPDLLLMYRYEGDNTLWLEGLGSHAELFGM
ncbi:MAG: type II toxin-antitoxin system YafQ family toxin [Synergistaceae bacterium]|nr:type II toxin-antitoxin system YafQ family toxin [Synergistaceae bacterium]